MLIYILIVLLILVLSKSINERKFKIQDIIVILVLSLVCGLRYKVGSDYLLYKDTFFDLTTYTRYKDMEIGFISLIKFLNFLGFSYTTFLCIVSFLTMSLTYYAIKKYTKFSYQSLFIFICMGYYAMCFNGIRQMLAVSICLFALKYLFNKNFIKYLIFILIASTCHLAVLIMIPVYFIANKNFTKKQLYLFLVFSILLYFLYEPILYAFTHIFTQYRVYYHNKKLMTYSIAGLGTYVIGILHILFSIILIRNKDKLTEKNKKNNKLINLYMFSIPFYVLGFCNTIIVRYTYYFAVYEIFLIPELLDVLIKKKNHIKTFVIILLFVIYFIVHLISFNQMLPYDWVIGKQV